MEGSAEWFAEVCRLQTSDSAGRNDVVHSVRHLLEIPEIDYRKNVMGDALDDGYVTQKAQIPTVYF